MPAILIFIHILKATNFPFILQQMFYSNILFDEKNIYTILFFGMVFKNIAFNIIFNCGFQKLITPNGSAIGVYFHTINVAYYIKSA